MAVATSRGAAAAAAVESAAVAAGAGTARGAGHRPSERRARSGGIASPHGTRTGSQRVDPPLQAAVVVVVAASQAPLWAAADTLARPDEGVAQGFAGFVAQV